MLNILCINAIKLSKHNNISSNNTTSRFINGYGIWKQYDNYLHGWRVLSRTFRLDIFVSYLLNGQCYHLDSGNLYVGWIPGILGLYGSFGLIYNILSLTFAWSTNV